MELTNRPLMAAAAKAMTGAAMKPTLRTVLKAVAAGVLVAGAGMAQAANIYTCAPRTVAGPGGFFNIGMGSLLAGDEITCGDKQFTINSFNFGAAGNLNFEWIAGANPGYADDLFSVAINFAPSIVGSASGFFDYSVKILDSNYRFDTVALDSTVAVNASSTGATAVIAGIFGGPTLVSLDGAPVDSVPLANQSPITVRDTWNVGRRDVMTNVVNTYTQAQVPVRELPLPGTLSLVVLSGLVGIGAARRKQA